MGNSTVFVIHLRIEPWRQGSEQLVRPAVFGERLLKSAHLGVGRVEDDLTAERLDKSLVAEIRRKHR